MSPLISVERLAELMAGPANDRPVVLDVRWRLGGPPGIEDFRRGHLPNAVFVDVDTDLSAAPGAGGRHPLPDLATFQRVLRDAGVDDDSTVVAYDDRDGTTAARAWWLVRWAGLAAERVSVLDGGYAAWTAAGLPVAAETADPVTGNMTVRAGQMPVLDADQAARVAATGVLLDARVPARYRGETEPVDPVAGHIPGARNAPAAAHVGPDGRWLPPARLAERFAGLGATATPATEVGATEVGATEVGATEVGATEVGAYCGSGVTAAAVVLALEYAGVCTPQRPAALYAGSWSHWCTDPARPVATGADAGTEP